jgi:diguanylate cyclase (GGDEF)-like protein
MLDIDHFKKFNDSYGHQAGDMALKTLGRLINESIRDSDLAARYGGEEFVLLMYHTELKEALVISERLRKLVEEYKFTIDDAEINITISLGIVSFPNQNMEIPDARTLIECADKALYKAKEQGRNRIEIF